MSGPSSTHRHVTPSLPKPSLVTRGPSLSAPYSLSRRCRSLYHGLWYRLSERIRWSRGTYRETPCGQLDGLSAGHIERIATLQQRYAVRFEAQYGRHTTLADYAVLDLLDQAWPAMGRSVALQGRVTDVGCANFWYARALHAFFQPAHLTGVDVEGYRLYPTGHSRYDAAMGHIADLPNTSFLVADYGIVAEQADIITAWFPFVTPTPVLAWRLPLDLFSPPRLFSRIAANLAPHGTFFMVNQGETEAAIAWDCCRHAGLVPLGHWVHPDPLRPRPHPPVASCWTR